MDNLAFMGQPLTGLRGTYTGFPPAIVTIGRWHSICGSIIITYMDNVFLFFLIIPATCKTTLCEKHKQLSYLQKHFSLPLLKTTIKPHITI